MSTPIFLIDANRKTWVYCIRQKIDVFYTFKKWKDLVENETRKRLKFLRSDNGGEHYNNEFYNYCSYYGIRREKKVLGTLQENGVSEKNEQDNHGTFKEYEIPCWVALTVLGRCCRYCCLLNKQRALKLLGWWHSIGGMDR
jgi:hypothetical protein